MPDPTQPRKSRKRERPNGLWGSSSDSHGETESLSLWQKIKLFTKLNKTWKEIKTMKSWKTSLGGILTALGISLTQMEGPEWLSAAGAATAAIGSLITALFARDNDKSSEDVGAG